MSDFEDLEADVRTYALVGRFLQVWSVMEISLHDAIGAALNIEPIQLRILCANITFRDKTNILRTLVDVSSLSGENKRNAKAKIRKLTNHAAKRNMVAHDPFLSDASGKGVEFITVKAKGDFQLPSIVWTPHRFAQENRALRGYSEFLKSLSNDFKKKPLTQQNYVEALRPFFYVDLPVPTQRIMSPALLNHLSQPVPIPPDSDQASQEKNPQKPDKPRG